MILNFSGNKLDKINLDITNVCNLKCRICYLDNFNRRQEKVKKYLPWSLFKKFINEIAVYENVDNLTVNLSGGEPFSHPDIFKMLSYTGKRHIRVVIFTNGLLLNEKKMLKIVKAGPEALMFSVDGIAGPHDLNKGRGNFDKVVRSIAVLSDLKRKLSLTKPDITINTVINKLNFANFEEIVPVARSIGCRRLYFSLVQWADKDCGENYLTEFKNRFGNYGKRAAILKGIDHSLGLLEKNEIGAVIKKISRIKQIKNSPDFSIYFFPDFSNALEIKRWFSRGSFRIDRCEDIYSQIRMDYDGQVTPGCSIPFYVLGNLKNGKLIEILNGNKAQKFTAEVKARGFFGVCQRCCRRSPLSRTK